MSLTNRESEAIEIALKYLLDNREAVLDTLRHRDDATDEVCWPNLLTEDQIKDLLDRIENGVLSLSPIGLMTVYVAYVDEFPRAVLTANEYMRIEEKDYWWDTLKTISVPIQDFNEGKVTVQTIKQYGG